MYAYIQGQLTVKSPTYVVVEAADIGYVIHISLTTYSSLVNLSSCKLYTWLHVKEDAHTLYGFFEEQEKRLFLHLIAVSGIGPGTAITMLSSLTFIELREAIVQGNASIIQRIKGIGSKSAQRLVLELQDKLQKESGSLSVAMPQAHKAREEALGALVTLGFTRSAAEKAIDKVIKQGQEHLPVEVIIKQALKNL